MSYERNLNKKKELNEWLVLALDFAPELYNLVSLPDKRLVPYISVVSSGQQTIDSSPGPIVAQSVVLVIVD